MMTKRDLCRKLRSENPEMPTLALARLIYKKNKLLFPSVDAIRTHLRSIEGKAGDRNRKSATQADKNNFFIAEDRPKNPYNLPESDETVYEPFVIKGHQRIAILNDFHAPYHNIEAITAALDYCKKEKVDAVIVTEMFDFHGGSRFMKDPSKRKMWEELKFGCEIFKIIHKTLKCKIYYKLGNHCERWMHYLWQKLKELDQLEDLEEIKELNFHTVLKRRLPDIPIEIIDDKRILKLNQLNVIHGHEFGGSIFSPVNIARGFYLRAKANTIGGHHHRTSSHTEQDINGGITATYSTGCLCELHPAYLPINSWNHGFAIVYLTDKPKGFHVKNLTIYNGRVL